ncbi:hypothetical protein [Erwinia sp. S59]|uniref:hypothetical protein n=1 Tax=Erwinia sp. S59 TaxID=2769340 RepID=UPI00190DB25A|nr:hypothetical protein [Erwinia sp. S59]MBK0091992.1 hypothetical protein [Erwinia sp. S59]
MGKKETDGTFDQIHTELRKVHNIRTPSGAVVKMDGDDKIWWAYFYTFSLTKRKKWCDFSLQKIADDHDVSTKTVTRNAKRLVEMGVLEVKPKERGRGNIYITISIPKLIAMKTKEKVTAKTEEIQENGKSFEEATKQPATDAQSTYPGDNLASGSITPLIGQHDCVASNDDSGGDAVTDDDHAVSLEQHDEDLPFPPKKTDPEDFPEGFSQPGEIADGEQVEGERLGYDEICEKAGAG